MKFARRHWSTWATPVAIVASFLYATIAIVWAAGGPGFPFGPGADPQANLSALGSVSQKAAAPVIAGLALLGTAVAVGMRRQPGSTTAHRVLLACGLGFGIMLTTVVPDARILVIAAYAPVLVVAVPLGWAPSGSIADVLTWPLLHQLVSMGLGLAWLGATLTFWRRIRGACLRCGRTDGRSDWDDRRRLRRIGHTAVAVAVVVPLLYAATRWAWVLGIPLGMDVETLERARAEGMLVAPAGLGSVAVGGALLTIGLVARWGEVFPAWLPRWGNRRVPPWLATVPATIVAIVIIAGGLSVIRLAIAETGGVFSARALVAFGPALIWPGWGIALAVAVGAYHYRRRGPCEACGRGEPESETRRVDPQRARRSVPAVQAATAPPR